MGRSLKRRPTGRAVSKAPPVRKSIPSFFERRGVEGGEDSEPSAPTSPLMPDPPEIPLRMREPPPQQEGRDPVRGDETGGTELHNILAGYMEQLPTKKDIEQMFLKMETAHKNDIEELRQDLKGMGSRIGEMEDTIPDLLTSIRSAQTAIYECHQQQWQIWSQVEDLEDRHRRNNIRLRGILENVNEAELIDVTREIFNSLLENNSQEKIEIDRLHRIPGNRWPEAKYPRDVLCRLHYFSQKERILNKAREKGPVDCRGAKVVLYSDISKRTRDKRRALRPLTQELVKAAIPYNWGFPFQLRVRKGGRTYAIQTPLDIPEFVKALELPQIEISGWPDPPAPTFPSLPQWNKWERPQRTARRRLEVGL